MTAYICFKIKPYMNIISKFTVGSEQGIDQLFDLKRTELKQMYGNIIEPLQLDTYIESQLDRRNAINELNDLNTQMIIVFVDNEPAGYAVMKSTFHQPKILSEKKAVQISSFFILQEYDTPETRQSLWQKCLSVTRSYHHWIEVLQTNPLITFLESCEFKIDEQLRMEPFDIPSYSMIRQINP